MEEKIAAINRLRLEEHPKKNDAQFRFVLNIKKTMSLRCQRRLSAEWQRSCIRSSEERRVAFQLFSPSSTSFLMNPQVRIHSGPNRTSLNPSRENQKPNEDRSQNDRRLSVSVSLGHSSLDCSSENAYDMVTEDQKEIPYCSRRTSSCNQKKTGSASELQLRTENTLAAIQADQILLTYRQLASNGNSASFNNIIYWISNLPKSLTTNPRSLSCLHPFSKKPKDSQPANWSQWNQLLLLFFERKRLADIQKHKQDTNSRKLCFIQHFKR